MAMLSHLQRIIRNRSGKVVVGGTALGLGTVGAAVAQQPGLQSSETSETGEDSAEVDGDGGSTTAIEVEGEKILVAVDDDVLEDALDDEGGAAEVETAADTPDSPDTATAAEESPATAEDESPVSPATAEDESPVSPATAEDESPVSPATAEDESPVSPATAEDESPDSPESP